MVPAALTVPAGLPIGHGGGRVYLHRMAPLAAGRSVGLPVCRSMRSLCDARVDAGRAGRLAGHRSWWLLADRVAVSPLDTDETAMAAGSHLRLLQ